MHEFGEMAARATRSASRAARVAEAVATGPLGALSHDELGVIFDGLADPLEPVVAVALSSTCLGLRTPLRAALEVLKERHGRAVALCRKVGWSCAELRGAEQLNWAVEAWVEGLTAADMATLAMILRTNGLPRLQRLNLECNELGDAGVQAFCEGLGHGTLPSYHTLFLGGNNIGPVGAEAVAAALRRGAMSKLVTLSLLGNPLGNQGVAALAAPLRTMPALKQLTLNHCEIGDEGVASLVYNLGKDDFKALETLYIGCNYMTDAGITTLAAALDAGGLPALLNDNQEFDPFEIAWSHSFLQQHLAIASAVQAVKDALAKRSSL